MPPFEVIEGDKGKQRNYVCPWCGQSFELRFITATDTMSLQEHWLKSKTCSNNKDSSNPTTTKYGMAGGIENIPGEATLNLIRSVNCNHPEELREVLRASMDLDSPVLGYRCGYCYTEVYNEQG